MTKTKLFQYAILWHPTEAEKKEGQKSTIVTAPTNILAVDDKAAATIAAMSIPEKYKDTVEQVEVAVRPF